MRLSICHLYFLLGFFSHRFQFHVFSNRKNLDRPRRSYRSFVSRGSLRPSSPHLTSPLAPSSLSARCLLSHSFYLWQNCSQYHVHTLSRNYVFFFYPLFMHTHTHIDLVGRAQQSETCCGGDRYNEAHCFNLNTTVLYFNFISSPPAWRRLELMM